MLSLFKRNIVIYILSSILISVSASLLYYYLSSTSKPLNRLGRDLVIEIASKHFQEARNLILRGADVNSICEHDPEQIDDDIRCIGWTPLHMAVFWCELDLTRFILEKGGKPNTKIGKIQVTPLHVAIMPNPYREDISEDSIVNAVTLLLEHGANPNIKNKYGKTPLDLAIECKYENVAKVLLANCAKS